MQIVFLTSEQFTNYFTQAYREHTLPAFRQRLEPFRSRPLRLSSSLNVSPLVNFKCPSASGITLPSKTNAVPRLVPKPR